MKDILMYHTLLFLSHQQRRILASRANPTAARRLGVGHVRGILLSGPPGCGKVRHRLLSDLNHPPRFLFALTAYHMTLIHTRHC